MNPSLVYIASSKPGNPYGVTVAQLNDATGELTIVQQDDAVSECQYLNFHPTNKFLYATTMDNDCEVVAFAVDENTGQVSALNRLPAEGGSPCYVAVDDSQKNVLMVNYNANEGRGNIRVYPIGTDGLLQANSEMIEHDGSSVNPDRQQESHPHMIVTTPDNRYAVVPDLGTDKVYLYALDTNAGTLTLAQTLDFHAGAGPRHVAFHPSLSLMYVINELDSTLTTFHYGDDNTWTHRSSVSTLPDDFPNTGDEVSYCADVHVHPNGRFLYGSNRGHNSLTIFELGTDGIPKPIAFQSTLGKWPRAFMITPNGKWLVVGNRHTDTAVVFAIDSDTGMLSHASTLDLPAPIAFKMQV